MAGAWGVAGGEAVIPTAGSQSAKALAPCVFWITSDNPTEASRFHPKILLAVGSDFGLQALKRFLVFDDFHKKQPRRIGKAAGEHAPYQAISVAVRPNASCKA
jgi:hypothetical protein